MFGWNRHQTSQVSTLDALSRTSRDHPWSPTRLDRPVCSIHKKHHQALATQTNREHTTFVISHFRACKLWNRPPQVKLVVLLWRSVSCALEDCSGGGCDQSFVSTQNKSLMDLHMHDLPATPLHGLPRQGDWQSTSYESDWTDRDATHSSTFTT